MPRVPLGWVPAWRRSCLLGIAAAWLHCCRHRCLQMLGGAGRRRRRLTRCSTSPAVPRVGPAHAGESPAPRRHPNHSEAPGTNHPRSARRHWEVKRDVRAIWQGLGTGRRCRSTLWACPGNGPARPGGAGSGAERCRAGHRARAAPCSVTQPWERALKVGLSKRKGNWAQPPESH